MFNRKLYKKLDKLSEILEKANIENIIYIFGSKKEILYRNLIAGISRGVGIGIGISIITAILVLIIQRIIRLNIPVLGEYLSDIMEIMMQKKF